jgi:membrane-bound ClpP family serine protease
LEIAAYACLFWGICFFYTSYLKQYHTGVVIGSILFLTGTIIFVFTRFEILNFGTVFIPSVLFVIGLSLLIANLLTKVNSVSIVFSILSLFAGTWLVISRGTATVELYLSSLFALAKSYWIVILFLGGIIFLAARNFKKTNDGQN